MAVDYSGLNPEQREAVFSDYNRNLCLAGAGSGKTSVLTHRMARLYESGVSPQNMLALTFTRAAGAEMKERVIGLIGADGKKLFCNTFHAFCVEVIRDNAEILGYEQNFSVYDQTECDELMKEVLTEGHYKIPTKRVADFRAGKTDGISAIERKQAERAVREYEFRLKRNNAFDFDGLIYTVKHALADRSGIYEDLRERYQYVFVDEFQDTDPAQWAIVCQMNPANLFIVGDDFQSIYGFRGSDISIIMGCAADPAWHTVKLERNYRSTLPIVAAANTLIKHNRQTEKRLISAKEGVAVDYREPENEDDEITGIIGRLTANQRENQRKTTAILARTNRQIENAKALLTARGVPCETNASSDSPLAGRHAKNLMAWIAAIANPQDDTAMQRVASMRMSKTDILEVERMQLDGIGSFTDALKLTDGGKHFLDCYNELAGMFISSDDTTSGARNLAENLRLPVSDAIERIASWQTRQDELGESATAADLLSYVRLTNFSDKAQKERDGSRAYLMTVHGSKGLEFDEVFIIGAAQGIFPGRGDLTEERRLFYVAITRAREYLNISTPKEMSDWSGNLRQTARSQFIGEALMI